MTAHDPERRRFLEGLGGLALAAWLPPIRIARDPGNPVLKPIPVSGERLPAIGMGSWITFNVPPMTDARERRGEGAPGGCAPAGPLGVPPGLGRFAGTQVEPALV